MTSLSIQYIFQKADDPQNLTGRQSILVESGEKPG